MATQRLLQGWCSFKLTWILYRKLSLGGGHSFTETMVATVCHLYICRLRTEPLSRSGNTCTDQGRYSQLQETSSEWPRWVKQLTYCVGVILYSCFNVCMTSSLKKLATM